MASGTLAIPHTGQPIMLPHRTINHPFNYHVGQNQMIHHQVHNQVGDSSRSRSKRGQPFDPEDLSRRLRVHLNEQKVLSDRRRAARALTAGEKVVYHHIPRVAAADFERTATSDPMRQVHKLAHPAVRNLNVLTYDESIHGKPVTSLQRSQALDRATEERNVLRNRNQYHWTRALERAAELDEERDVYRCPRREFNTDPPVHRTRQVVRPMSMGMGDMLWEKGSSSSSREEKRRSGMDRHDWSQQDENGSEKLSLKERFILLVAKKGKEAENKTMEGIVAPKTPQGVKKARRESLRDIFIRRRPT